MKTLSLALVVAALALSSAALPANAAGCIRGAAVGGVAGHLAGHHSLAGAAIGCAVGHHEAAKRTREEGDDRYR
jgi:hypothetical protein